MPNNLSCLNINASLHNSKRFSNNLKNDSFLFSLSLTKIAICGRLIDTTPILNLPSHLYLFVSGSFQLERKLLHYQIFLYLIGLSLHLF